MVIVVPVILNTQVLNLFCSEKGETNVSWRMKNGSKEEVGCQASFREEKEVGGMVVDSMSRLKFKIGQKVATGMNGYVL